MGFFGNKGKGGQWDRDQAAFGRYYAKTASATDPRVLRVFDRNGYYTCHGNDALCVAKGLFRNTAVVKYWGAGANGAKLPTVNLNKASYENVCRMVLVDGTAFAPTGEETTTTTATVTTSAGAGEATVKKSILHVYASQGSQSWVVAKQGSPSKLEAFEEELSVDLDSAQPVVLSVVVQDKNRKEYDQSLLNGTAGSCQADHVVGVAFCNPQGEGATSHGAGGSLLEHNHHAISSCEFLDDQHFCTLESLVIQSGAKECYVHVLDQEAKSRGGSRAKVLDVFDRCGVLVTEREAGKKDEFSPEQLERDLGRLVEGGFVERCREVLDRKVASRATQNLLGFAELLTDKRNYGKWDVRVHDNGKHMRMDAAAVKALNVTPTHHAGGGASSQIGSHFSSLTGLLSRGRTAMGKRLARTWLKQPLLGRAQIDERLDVVEAFASDLFLREEMRDHYLRGVPDIDRLVRKLERGTATLVDLCLLYRCSGRLDLLCDHLEGYKGPHADLVARKYVSSLRQCHDKDHLVKFEELLEAAIDLDRVPEEFLISPQYSDELLALHGEKVEAEDAIRREAESIAEDLGLVLDKSVKFEWHKYSNKRERCMRITSKEEKAVRKHLQSNYTILETRKDGTKFVNSKLKHLAKSLRGITETYDKTQEELVQQVVTVAQSFSGLWQKVGGILGELDCLCGFADVACSGRGEWSRPKVLDSSQGKIALRGCRHPLVEEGLEQDFIANDLEMEKGQGSWAQLITGPNMGGKSTYIRQVGVAVLLAQVGMFVPARGAEISIRDAIFARVGAGDCQMRGVSTFMAEMLETSAILKAATSDSLVIIDELGRGTSTQDGLGLAQAVCEHLMQEVGAATLFATHFHELTNLEGVTNKHVGYPLDYQLRPGPSKASFGIEVAEKLNFPPEVLGWARDYETRLSKRVKLTPPAASHQHHS
ncbi:DNA mismatch repair protein MSH2 [Chloropicon primus]|uniref:DNA mismatch repair protein MSH2 n=1 Tax=Chloropicon primus TaxID=1764295 RepID=A0A5B8MFL6_9CHLO|nr:DNA mismatch repair protein MSH2 [Chloropicon primus]UPQ98668.1 DNA mismatch repair protein MSH2 [Chloropicon primus]|eukprot:QDZ19458.1 DNA mismatch repair protein MSH2 [Chloropicon primus]